MNNNTILFPAITRPGRYLGYEFNSQFKPWEQTAVRFALIFPDLYEIGMSHLGLQILYHLLNGEADILAERCYCPDLDVEKMLRENKKKVATLESGTPLDKFDVVGITLPYELCFTNILTILNLAAIPFYAKDRDDSFPLLLGGGSAAMNPEPVADFFDAILLGDGEEAILEIASLLRKAKQKNPAKQELLEQVSQIQGIYVPSQFRPEYEPNGKITAIHHQGKGPSKIARRIVNDLNEIDHLKHPLVPNARIVHDRLGIEVARGCTRGCRFCQAGITYRPVRERSLEKIKELAEAGLANSGFEELALLSLSTGDYSCLEQLLPELMNRFAEERVSVAMPSMRVGTLTPAIMEQVKRVRKSGFTLAPEAGSERLRRVINKGITEEDLLATCRQAFDLGWLNIKLYFMIGLPGETREDLDAIGKLAATILRDLQKSGRGKKQISISVGTFVPKPHTPFQRAGQLSITDSIESINHLRASLPRKGCVFKYHRPQISYLEGVFSRGDRRLAPLIIAAWQKGARLDGWDEHFNLQSWQDAAQLCGLDLDSYLLARSWDEILPWDHLDSGVDPQFLRDEMVRAEQEIYTPDCRYHACQKCGVCDFKTIQPTVCNRKYFEEMRNPEKEIAPPPAKEKKQQPANHYKYIVHYLRKGNISYLGHLELLQVIFRTLKRAQMPLHYSQGFNPSPKVSFSPALAAGTESLAEFFIMDLSQPLHDLAEVQKRINITFPPGLKVNSIELHSGEVATRMLTEYKLKLPRKITQDERNAIANFLASSTYLVEKTRKGKTKAINIRPMIPELQIDADDVIRLHLISISAEPGIKPIEAITQILGLNQEDSIGTTILKTGWRKLAEEIADEPQTGEYSAS